MFHRSVDSGLLALLLTVVWIAGSQLASGMFGFAGFAAPLAAMWGILRSLRARPTTKMRWLGLVVNVLVVCLMIIGWVRFFSAPD